MILDKKFCILWRRALMLSAAFFCLAFVATSCKKKKNPYGEGVLPPGSTLSSSGIDTFQLRTSTIEEDSVITINPRFNLIGSYNDPVFGSVEANFYTQFSLSSFSPAFGNLNEIAIDSMVMAFEFGGYYGEISEQLFEVYEITEDLSGDNSYYSFSTANVNTQNLVPTANNEGQIKPDPSSNAIVGDDTLNPQLRIPLDTTFARDLMILAAGSSDNETFQAGFKGLHFKVNNLSQGPGEGTVFYLETTNPASKMTIYFTKDGEQNSFDFLIGGGQIDFNHVETDNSGTRVEQVINDPSLGQEEFYAQAFQSRAKIEIPSLNDIPNDVIVHQATLEIPISYFPESDYYPSEAISVTSRIYENDDRLFLVKSNPIQYNIQRRAYVIDLRQYVQNVLKGEFVNSGLVISPQLFNTTVERIIFNGPETDNKKQPKFSIVYTEL